MRFTVPADHPCLPGHFPGHPVVPGVVVLDRVLEAVESATGRPAGRLRLPQIKFLQPLLPMQEAQVELQPVEGQAGDRWRFRVHHGEALIASGEIVAVADAAPGAPGAAS